MTRKRELTDAARAMLTGSEEERIDFIRRNRWFGYAAAREALETMERLLAYPPVTRPLNFMLIADTNNGKTTIVERFEALHPAVDDPHAARAERPVMLISCPPGPDEGRFYNHMLKTLNANFKVTDDVDKKLFQIQNLLQKLGTRLVIFDEIDNSIAGPLNKRHLLLNALRGLGKAIERPIVFTGTFEALLVLRDFRPMQNRFQPQVLPKWELNEEFLQFLISFEMTLPLKKASNLASEQLASLLFVMSGGLIGELSNLLKLAAEVAVRGVLVPSGIEGEPPKRVRTERITRALLLSLKWGAPDLRDAAASAAQDGVNIDTDYQKMVRQLLKAQVDGRRELEASDSEEYKTDTEDLDDFEDHGVDEDSPDEER